jgi:hypothetical protein
LALAFLFVAVAPVMAQDDTESRNETREKLRATLESAGQLEDVDVEFHQSTKQPYNFVGIAKGLPNVESLEIVLRVTSNDTIQLRVYPHFKGGYINLDKLKDAKGLMRKLLEYNDSNFLYWGADDSGDLFSGYSITLESGYPDEAMTIVLRSIRSTDRFVAELRQYIDGSKASPNTAKED